MERFINDGLLERITELARGTEKRLSLDSSHSFSSHALPVAENCRRIAQTYCGGQVDLDVVYVAGLLHDIERDGKGHNGHKRAKEILEKSGAPAEFTQTVLNVIQTHSDLTAGNSLEERVLWLADKLEYFSIDRLEQAMKMLPKFMFNMIFNKYAEHWKSRVRPILEEVERLDKDGFSGIAEEFGSRLLSLKVHFKTKRPQFLPMLNGVNI